MTTSAPMLFNLVYCSRAAAGVDEAAVDAIIATARRANPTYGITGMLVFGGGIFFQWLEGPRPAVESLMAQIQRDPRHQKVVMLSSAEESRERLFPSWDMEHVGIDNIREVLADAIDSATEPHNTAALNAMLAELEATALLSRLA